MFRPAVAIIRFFHSKQLRLFYIIRVTACWWGDIDITVEWGTQYYTCRIHTNQEDRRR